MYLGVCRMSQGFHELLIGFPHRDYPERAVRHSVLGLSGGEQLAKHELTELEWP